MKTDGPSVCVVGAGAVGLCAALALARRGASQVSVIEARHPAAGSSGLSVGIVETQYLDPLDIELRVHSMRFFERLERDHGLEIVRNGYLRLGHTPDSPSAFQRSVERQHALGVGDATVLDRAQIARFVPDLRTDDLLAGLFGPSDGFIDGHLYCTLLAELAAHAGVSLLAGCELLGAEPRAGGGLHLIVGDGRAVDGRAVGHGRAMGDGGAVGDGRAVGDGAAVGDRRRLDCDLVIDAAGPWAGRVAELLGHRLELAPQRRQAVAVHLPRVLPYTMPSVMDYTPGSGEQGLYFRHEGPGRLIAGLHSEEAHDTSADPDAYARAADEPFLEEVARKLAERLPSLADARLGGGWAGLYPVSPTGRPLVGPLAPGAPVIVAGGAGGSGIQLSPALGELAADWAIEGAPHAVRGAEALAPTPASRR